MCIYRRLKFCLPLLFQCNIMTDYLKLSCSMFLIHFILTLPENKKVSDFRVCCSTGASARVVIIHSFTVVLWYDLLYFSVVLVPGTIQTSRVLHETHTRHSQDSHRRHSSWWLLWPEYLRHKEHRSDVRHAGVGELCDGRSQYRRGGYTRGIWLKCFLNTL